MKKALITLLLLIAALCAPALAEADRIDNWAADSPAMQSIVAFVTASVDESSEGFIPVEDRVAVFDMDGTLYGERFPTYFNDWLYIQRALYDDTYDAPEELKAFAQAWEDKVLRGVAIDDFDAKERELGPKLYEGLTPDAYAEVVRRFKAMDVRGFEGMTYGEAFFQPMVSLVKYLYDHDYAVYIVSATYRDAVRVMTEGVLDDYIPRDRVIGTDLLYVASGDADQENMFYELTPEDELVIAGELFIKNQKTNKASVIQREIGRLPVLCFGNSTGDFSMATYTLQNEKYGGRAYMLLCDDTLRDYGDPEAAAAFREKCEANGFITVSEKDEFETLYPEGVHMAEAVDDTEEPSNIVAIDPRPQSIGLAGVSNARELGGYKTADGRTVKQGAFLRTASLAKATEADIRRLKDVYHLAVVADLRMTSEIEAAPDPEIDGVKNIHLGVMDEAAMKLKRENLRPEDREGLDLSNRLDQLRLAIRAGIVGDQMYVDILSGEPGKAGYARMFQELMDLPEDGALLFHCTQGKDRTGCAAMLILSALGVDEETIMADYMLTNTFNAHIIESERSMLKDMGVGADELDTFMAAMDQVNEQYMVNALDWMKANYGSALGYITDALGVTETQIEALRDKYLEGEIVIADAA